VLDRLGRAAVNPTFDSGAIRQQEGPSSEAGSPDPLESSLERPEDKASDRATEHVALMEPMKTSLHLDGASPSNSQMDDKELEQTHPTTPTSSALDLPYSIRYGIDSTRVCNHMGCK